MVKGMEFPSGLSSYAAAMPHKADTALEISRQGLGALGHRGLALSSQGSKDQKALVPAHLNEPSMLTPQNLYCIASSQRSHAFSHSSLLVVQLSL